MDRLVPSPPAASLLLRLAPTLLVEAPGFRRVCSRRYQMRQDHLHLEAAAHLAAVPRCPQVEIRSSRLLRAPLLLLVYPLLPHSPRQPALLPRGRVVLSQAPPARPSQTGDVSPLRRLTGGAEPGTQARRPTLTLSDLPLAV